MGYSEAARNHPFLCTRADRPDAVLRHGLAAMQNPPRLLESENLEERKECVRAFVAGITVVPAKLRLDLPMRALPAVLDPDFTCELVAGACWEAVQMYPEPAERGPRHALPR
jgi:hypothetical protein